MRVTKLVKDDERSVLDLLNGARMEPLTPSSENAYCAIKDSYLPV
jgi:hypothetical protein